MPPNIFETNLGCMMTGPVILFLGFCVWKSLKSRNMIRKNHLPSIGLYLVQGWIKDSR